MTSVLASSVALALVLAGAPASAQRFETPLPEAVRAQRSDERVRAWTLLAEGAASTAVGVPMALAAGDDDRLRWAGWMTLAFGAVNAALAVPWLLRLRSPAAPPAGSTELSERLWRGRAAERSGAVFALNLGLDVLYVTAGAVAWGLAAGDERLRGGGIAVVAQGAFLLAFDLWGWIASDRNAGRYTDLSAAEPAAR